MKQYQIFVTLCWCAICTRSRKGIIYIYVYIHTWWWMHWLIMQFCSFAFWIWLYSHNMTFLSPAGLVHDVVHKQARWFNYFFMIMIADRPLTIEYYNIMLVDLSHKGHVIYTYCFMKLFPFRGIIVIEIFYVLMSLGLSNIN